MKICRNVLQPTELFDERVLDGIQVVFNTQNHCLQFHVEPIKFYVSNFTDKQIITRTMCESDIISRVFFENFINILHSVDLILPREKSNYVTFSFDIHQFFLATVPFSF